MSWPTLPASRSTARGSNPVRFSRQEGQVHPTKLEQLSDFLSVTLNFSFSPECGLVLIGGSDVMKKRNVRPHMLMGRYKTQLHTYGSLGHVQRQLLVLFVAGVSFLEAQPHSATPCVK